MRPLEKAEGVAAREETATAEDCHPEHEEGVEDKGARGDGDVRGNHDRCVCARLRAMRCPLCGLMT